MSEENFNTFKDGIFEMGQIVEYTKGGGKRFNLYEIKCIYIKDGYNMYLCEHLKTKCKTTITDMDYYCKNAYVMDDVEV